MPSKTILNMSFRFCDTVIGTLDESHLGGFYDSVFYTANVSISSIKEEKGCEKMGTMESGRGSLFYYDF